MTATTWRELPAKQRREIVSSAADAYERPADPFVAEVAQAWALRQVAPARTALYGLAIVAAGIAVIVIVLAWRNLVFAGVVGAVGGIAAGLLGVDAVRRRTAAQHLLTR